MESSQAILEAILTNHLRLLLRSYVEADGRHASVYPAPAGYLAIAQNIVRTRCTRAVVLLIMEVMH